MSTNVLVNQSEKLRSMDGWYIQKARVESSQSSFAFESVTKVSFSLPAAEILRGLNSRAFLVCGFLMKSVKKKS